MNQSTSTAETYAATCCKLVDGDTTSTATTSSSEPLLRSEFHNENKSSDTAMAKEDNDDEKGSLLKNNKELLPKWCHFVLGFHFAALIEQGMLYWCVNGLAVNSLTEETVCWLFNIIVVAVMVVNQLSEFYTEERQPKQQEDLLEGNIAKHFFWFANGLCSFTIGFLGSIATKHSENGGQVMVSFILLWSFHLLRFHRRC